MFAEICFVVLVISLLLYVVARTAKRWVPAIGKQIDKAMSGVEEAGKQVDKRYFPPSEQSDIPKEER